MPKSQFTAIQLDDIHRESCEREAALFQPRMEISISVSAAKRIVPPRGEAATIYDELIGVTRPEDRAPPFNYTEDPKLGIRYTSCGSAATKNAPTSAVAKYVTSIEHIKKEEYKEMRRAQVASGEKTWAQIREEEKDDFVEGMRQSVANVQLPPKERYLEPMLSSHVIGWVAPMTQAVNKSQQKWKKANGSSDVTEFASAYALANNGAGIFALTKEEQAARRQLDAERIANREAQKGKQAE